MKPSLVSVIVTYHNEGDLLLNALESIAQQTYRGKVEVVIVDDASDILPEPPSGYRFPTRVFRSETNLRAAVARNLGIQMSRGGFVSFLDADDVYLPNRIELHANYLQNHPEVDVVGGTSVIHREGKSWHKVPDLINNEFPGLVDRSTILPEVARIGICTSYGFHTGAMTFRKDALTRICGFDARCRWGEEWDLLVRIFQSSRVGFIPDPAQLYLCRNVGSITSTQDPEKYEAGAMMFRRWRKTIRGLPLRSRRDIKAREMRWRLFASQIYLENSKKPGKALAQSVASLACSPSMWGIRSTMRNTFSLLKASSQRLGGSLASRSGVAASSPRS